MRINHQLIRESFFKRFRRKIYPLFWFIAAADESLLNECSIPEQDKQASIGVAILCTTVAAIISFYYAIYSLFNSWFVALPISIFWGIVILNLDRFMVGSIRKDRKKRWWNELKIAFPRILLAFFIAILISKPLEVKIFQNQIDEAASDFKSSLRSTKFRFESGELAKKIDERKEANDYLAQSKIESTDKTKDAAYRQYYDEYNDCLKERNILQGKLDKSYKERQRARDNNDKYRENKLTAEIQNLYRQINALGCLSKKRLMDERGKDYIESQLVRVALAQKRFDKITTDVNTAADNLEGKREDANKDIERAGNDILGKLRILKVLKDKDKNKDMMWAGLLITSLFLILEVAPLMVKIFSPRGEYDTLLATAEKQAFDNEEAAEEESNQRKISRKKAAFKTSAQIDEIDEKVQKQIQEKILNAQAELAEKIVEVWKKQEEAELQSNSSDYLKKMITKTI